jgi:hypothetical protein
VASAAGIARSLGARRQGSNWRTRCPCECGYALSLRDGENGLLLHCFGGCAFSEILTALVEYGLLDDDDAVLPRCEKRASAVRSAEQDACRIEHARRIYAEADYGSLVATYLYEARGISVPPPDVLREHLHCPHRLGARLPAMLAPVVDVGGELSAVHCTYLRADGSGKADLGDPELQRETRGKVRGGVVRLAVHDPDRELIVGEGVESALSASEILKLPAWSAVSASGLKTLELPLSVRRICIAADHDAAGVNAAVTAARRWQGEGRVVRVVLPAAAGDDFNDVLIKRRPG